jgi:TolB-like protein
MEQVTYRLGQLILQPFRQLLDSDTPVLIGRKALDILSVLAKADGQLVTKDELMAAVWPNLIVEENVIQVHIVALRKALGPDADLLTTVRGLGYRLSLTGAKAPSLPFPKYSASESAVDNIRANSIAVLPFANLTGDADKDYLGEGMAEELIHVLSQVPGLKVSARTSSFAFAGRNIDARQIARDLGVGKIIEGSVRGSGAPLRVTVQLIDGASGFHLWSQNFDRYIENLLELHAELAQGIARALEARLAPVVPPTKSVEAYRAYLQAAALRASISPANFLRAGELFTKAIEYDPNFARAYAGLAMICLIGSNLGLFHASRFADARQYALRALEIDPSNSEAHSTLSTLEMRAARWLQARVHFKAALALNPNDPVIHSCHAMDNFTPVGQVKRSVELAERGLQLSPTWPTASLQCSVANAFAANYPHSIWHADTAVAMGLAADQINGVIGRYWAALSTRDSAEVARHIELVVPPPLATLFGGSSGLHDISFALCGGDPDPTLTELNIIMSDPITDAALRRWPYSVGIFAEWYILMGDFDRAFGLASRLIDDWTESGEIDIVSLGILWRPEHRIFRQDPRFHDFITRLDFFSYWQQHGPPDGYIICDGRLVEHP